MNTRRLFNIVRRLNTEVKGIVPTVQQLVNQLEQAINQPNESTQRAVEKTLTQLLKTLSDVPSNTFSPGIFEDMRTLIVNGESISTLVGKGLANELKPIFAGGYTSVQTLDRLRKFQTDLSALSDALEKANAGLAGLGLKDEQLEPGTSVVGMSIPRELVNDVVGLEKEIEFLGRFIGDLVEVQTGTFEKPQVYSLHSSWFGIELLTPIQVAALTATLIGGIKSTLDLAKGFRDLVQNAQSLGVEDEMIEKLTEKSKQQAEEKLEALTAEIIQHTTITDAHRLNELKTSIRIDLNRLTNKIESGFTFDVRTELPKNASTETKEQAVAITQFRFEPIQGPRLLELPETTEQLKEQPKKKKPTPKKESKA